MKFVQYFHKSAISDELVETCGDRGVIILDGRQNTATHITIAKEEGAKRGYLAFQIWRGENLLRGTVAVTRIIRI